MDSTANHIHLYSRDISNLQSRVSLLKGSKTKREKTEIDKSL